MVFYCKVGELLRVDPLVEEIHKEYFKVVTKIPFIEAIKSSNKKTIEIPQNSIVMALEASVPPWYASDRIRCLYNDTVVFIGRKFLKK